MLVKFFPHGTGGGAAPIDYLLGKKRDREDATVLSGNPELTEQLIDAASGRHRYTSGVLSFAETISDKVAYDCVNLFEDWFTGSGAAELNFLWVMHKEHNRTELHFVIPNTELRTGRAFHPHIHHLDVRGVDALKDWVNAIFKLADPNDPARKRFFTNPADYLKTTKDRKALLKAVNAYMSDLVTETISNDETWTHNDTTKALESLDLTISRAGKNYVTVQNKQGTKVRLKGGLYERDCRLDSKSAAEASRASREHRAELRKRVDELKREYEQRLQQRRERISERYGRAEELEQGNAFDNQKQRTRDNERSRESDDERQKKNDAEFSRVEQRSRRSRATTEESLQSNDDFLHGRTSSGSSSSGSASSGSNIFFYRARKDGGSNSTAARTGAERAAGSNAERDFRSFAERGEMRGGDGREREDRLPFSVVVIEFRGRKLGELHDFGNRVVAHGLGSKAAAFNIVKAGVEKGWKKIQFDGSDDFLRHAMRMALDRGLEVVAKDDHQSEILKEVMEAKERDDRARAETERRIGEADRASDELKSVRQSLNAASRRLGEAGGELERAGQRFAERDRGTEREALRMAYDDELDRFKREINLAEYMQACGWRLNPKKSTAKAAVLEADGRKAIVSQAGNGHYIWFDPATGKGGSIIDFVQAEQGLNLGQVRKELRPMIGADFSSLSPHLQPVRLERSSADEQALERARMAMTEKYAQLRPLDDRYLRSRGITISTDPRFANVRTDDRGNTVFPHYQGGGVVGWEVKNKGFTGYAKGGAKAGIYATTNFKDAQRVVIVESGIDAMSHAQLFNTDNSTAYISIGGQLTERQLNVLAKNLSDKEVTIATDNDLAGFEFANKIKLSIHHAKRETPNLKDWNDDLRAEQQAQQEQQERAATRSGFDLSM